MASGLGIGLQAYGVVLLGKHGGGGDVGAGGATSLVAACGDGVTTNDGAACDDVTATGDGVTTAGGGVTATCGGVTAGDAARATTADFNGGTIGGTARDPLVRQEAPSCR